MHKQRGEDTEIGRKQQNEGKERAEESAVGGVGKGIWRGRKEWRRAREGGEKKEGRKGQRDRGSGIGNRGKWGGREGKRTSRNKDENKESQERRGKRGGERRKGKQRKEHTDTDRQT